jgi:hypothetical protein
MADNNPKLQAEIVTTFDGKGAAEAKRTVQETIKGFDQLSQEAQRTLRGDTEATEKSISSKHRLRGAVKGIAFEFPVLARLAGFFFNPLSATVGGAIAVFGALQQRIERLKESLQPGAGFKSFADAMNKQAEALQNAALEAGRFAIEVTRVQSATDKAIAAANLEVEALQRKVQLIQAETEALKALEKAKVDAAEAAGKIDPQTASLQRLGIDQKFDERGRIQKKQSQDEVLDLKRNQLTQLRGQQITAGADVFRAGEALRARGVESPDVIRERIQRAGSNLDVQKGDVEKTRRRIGTLEKSETRGPIDEAELKDLRSVLPGQEQALEQLTAVYKKETETATARQLRWDELSGNLAAANDAFKANKAAIERLTSQIESQSRQFTDEQSGAERIGGIQKETRQIEIGTIATQQAKEAKGTAAEIVSAAQAKADPNLSNVQNVAQEMATNKITESAQVVDEIVRLLTGIGDAHNAHFQVIRDALLKQKDDLRKEFDAKLQFSLPK